MNPLAERAVGAVARTVGGLLLVLGVVGLVRTHLDGFASNDGVAFLKFTVNPLTNLLHAAAGLIGVPMALTTARARTYIGVLGAVAVPFGLLEFALRDTTADIFGRDTGLALLHVILGAGCLAVWAWSRGGDRSVTG